MKHLGDEENNPIFDVLVEYEDMFNTKGPLAATPVTQNRIPTGNNPPVYRKLYRVPCLLQSIMEEVIDQQLKDGIIEQSDLPWGANVVIVPKKCRWNEEIQVLLRLDT